MLDLILFAFFDIFVKFVTFDALKVSQTSAKFGVSSGIFGLLPCIATFDYKFRTNPCSRVN